MDNNINSDISSFEDFGLCDNLKRGIYSLGFDRPNEIDSGKDVM